MDADGARGLVVIGASTGGPRVLQELLPLLPGDLPVAWIIVQHLPDGFTNPFVQNLARIAHLPVKRATHGRQLARQEVLVAPTGWHLAIRADRCVELVDGPRRHGVRPAIDVTLEAGAAVFGTHMVAVILTGLGQDGTLGACAVRTHGGYVLAQDQESSAARGMPQSAIATGVVQGVARPPELPAKVRDYFRDLAIREAIARKNGVDHAPE